MFALTLMVCGVAGSLDIAMQAATAGLSKWLAQLPRP
jgi:hypothetical protein